LRSHRAQDWIVLVLAAIVVVLSAARFAPASPTSLELYPSPSLTRQTWLSDYNPALKGTPGDTPVLVFEGAEPGGTMLVLGGTHPDEPAGCAAALVLAENVMPEQGRVIVIPYANASGFTHNLPQEGHPSHYTLDTPNGRRTIPYGARLSNPVHQWPDPTVYVESVRGQKLAGVEARNLNRAYPGLQNGTLTSKVAYAITSLIREEQVDVSVDLHESSPEYPVNNAIVAHDRALDLAAITAVELELSGVAMNIEPSPESLRGFSHREWGDNTDTYAVLFESPNPAQGRLRGKTDEQLIIDGQDPMYLKASSRGRLYVPYTEEGTPLAMRVGRHIASIAALATSHTMLAPDRGIVLSGLPTYDELVSNGVGAYLSPSER
jgi:hypothetical protein